MADNKQENLDDVISDLIDVEPDKKEEKDTFAGIEKPSKSKFETVEKNVSLTERAAKQVEKIRAQEELEGELYLRVAVEGGGCSGLSYKLGFDFKSDEDEIFESNGIEIIVDPRHMIYLEGIEIDFPDGLDARGFTFNNPNADETCGCGTSFAV